MTANTLRHAATLMRELAGHANADHRAPWRHGEMLDRENDGHFVAYGSQDDDYDNTVAVLPYDFLGATAEHIASWHPAVALAVADWLDMQAGCVQNYGPNAESPWVKPHTQMALAVARAYLGEES